MSVITPGTVSCSCSKCQIIVADNCMAADAIATAVMVKGFDNGLYWINQLKNIECLLIEKQANGQFKKGKSSGFIYELIE